MKRCTLWPWYHYPFEPFEEEEEMDTKQDEMIGSEWVPKSPGGSVRTVTEGKLVEDMTTSVQSVMYRFDDESVLLTRAHIEKCYVRVI
jgi:hypothetical protein